MKTTLLLPLFLLISSSLFSQVTDGLVGDFPFTSGSFDDETGFEDGRLSTNLGDGTYVKVPDRFGNQDCAIDFQGAVIEAGTYDRTILSEVSISFWMKTDSVPEGLIYIITKYGNNAQDIPFAGYSVVYLDTVRFDSRDEDWHHNQYMTSNFSQTQVGDGEWHHVVGVSRNDSSLSTAVLEIWVDGVKEMSTTYNWMVTDLNNPRRQLCIAGSDNYTSMPTFIGVLDDIKIFNRGLDSSEVVQLYEAPNPLVRPLLEISASDTISCVNSTIQFTSDTTDADSIHWDFGDGSISTEANPEHSYIDTGNYLVFAVAKNQVSGLTSSDTIASIIIHPIYQDTFSVEVMENDLPYEFGSQSLTDSGTYVESFTSFQGCDSVVTLRLTVIETSGLNEFADRSAMFSIYPNPAKSTFKIQIDQALDGPVQVTIQNITGVEVFRINVEGVQDMTLSARRFAHGVYLVKVSNRNYELTRKLMIE